MPKNNLPFGLMMDFDQTLTKEHTHYTEEDGRVLENEKRKQNVRNFDFLNTFLIECHARKNLCCIVTMHRNILHVASYLGTILDEESLMNLSDHRQISYKYEEEDYAYFYDPEQPVPLIFSCLGKKKNGKNHAIYAALALLDQLEHEHPNNDKWLELHQNQLILVDDTQEFCNAAANEGMIAIHAPPGDTEYMNKLCEVMDIKLPAQESHENQIITPFHSYKRSSSKHNALENKKQRGSKEAEP